MRTTVEIPDPLFEEIRALATRQGVTMKTLMERGLRRVLADATECPMFRLRRASFKGNGLNPDLAEAGWDRLRALAHEGRGG